jgi:lysyl-tRNA synthetase class 2
MPRDSPPATSVPLRDWRRAGWLPALAAAAAALVGVLNVASALTPDFAGRAHELLRLVPHDVPDVAHVLVLPGGVGLLVVAVYLARRRRRAWSLAVGLLLALGVANLFKGLDWEEALASWSLAAVLASGRQAFHVLHDDGGLWTVIRRVALIAGVAFGVALTAVVAASHWATAPLTSPATAVIEAARSLMLLGGPVHFREPMDWLPARLGWLGVGALLAAAYVIFRPLAASARPPEESARALARRLVSSHGRDTLSFFKLRGDALYFFSADRRAFLAYRVNNGVLLVSGDPVGPADAVQALIRDVASFAEVRGLRLAFVGASEELREQAADAGLRSFYLGDEAIVETAAFSLEGRQIRKVRQSVSRLTKGGFSAELARFAELPEATLRELEAVSARWLDGDPERGFSMAMDSLRGDHLGDSAVLLARDESGAVRGFLHFVPAYGRSAMSLGFMRRERDTPNGLTEFMVVHAIELLRAEGVGEVSLNFAAFARWLYGPESWWQRLLGRLIPLADRHFQIESLYRFNAKFNPRWQPRYLLYEGPLGLPRAGIAALSAEGQMPQLPRPASLMRRAA